MSAAKDAAMLALVDAMAEIEAGEVRVDVGTADDLHRALRRLAEIGLSK